MPKPEHLPRQARDKRVKGTSVENSQNRFVSFRSVSFRCVASCSTRDIKKKYRQLSMELHPDKPGGDAEKFAQVLL